MGAIAVMQDGGADGSGDNEETVTIFLDEIPMLRRPPIAAAPTDREVWADPMPGDGMKNWKKAYGEIDEVFKLPSQDRGYVLFKEADAAAKCVGAHEGYWSESERAIAGQPSSRTAGALSAYSESFMARFLGKDGFHLRTTCGRIGIRNLQVFCGGPPGKRPLGKDARVHLVAKGAPAQLNELHNQLEVRVNAVHEELTAALDKMPQRLVAAKGIPPGWTTEEVEPLFAMHGKVLKTEWVGGANSGKVSVMFASASDAWRGAGVLDGNDYSAGQGSLFRCWLGRHPVEPKPVAPIAQKGKDDAGKGKDDAGKAKNDAGKGKSEFTPGKAAGVEDENGGNAVDARGGGVKGKDRAVKGKGSSAKEAPSDGEKARGVVVKAKGAGAKGKQGGGKDNTAPDGSAVLIENCPPAANEDELRELCGYAGTVLELTFMPRADASRQRPPRQTVRSAVCKFAEPDAADKAMNELAETEYLGHTLVFTRYEEEPTDKYETEAAQPWGETDDVAPTRESPKGQQASWGGASAQKHAEPSDARAAPSKGGAARPSVQVKKQRKPLWEKLRDPASGRAYYWDHTEGQPEWTAPAQGNYWDKVVDDSTGRPYFVHAGTGETTWRLPYEEHGAIPPEGEELPAEDEAPEPQEEPEDAEVEESASKLGGKGGAQSGGKSKPSTVADSSKASARSGVKAGSRTSAKGTEAGDRSGTKGTAKGGTASKQGKGAGNVHRGAVEEHDEEMGDGEADTKGKEVANSKTVAKGDGKKGGLVWGGSVRDNRFTGGPAGKAGAKGGAREDSKSDGKGGTKAGVKASAKDSSMEVDDELPMRPKAKPGPKAKPTSAPSGPVRRPPGTSGGGADCSDDTDADRPRPPAMPPNRSRPQVLPPSAKAPSKGRAAAFAGAEDADDDTPRPPPTPPSKVVKGGKGATQSGSKDMIAPPSSKAPPPDRSRGYDLLHSVDAEVAAGNSTKDNEWGYEDEDMGEGGSQEEQGAPETEEWTWGQEGDGAHDSEGANDGEGAGEHGAHSGAEGEAQAPAEEEKAASAPARGQGAARGRDWQNSSAWESESQWGGGREDNGFEQSGQKRWRSWEGADEESHATDEGGWQPQRKRGHVGDAGSGGQRWSDAAW